MDSSMPNEKTEGDVKAATGNSKSSPEQPESTTANNPAAVELLEEDDEFEEFADEDWDDKAEDEEDVAQWQEDWDDDDVDDDFCNTLRKELEQTAAVASLTTAENAR